MPPFSDQKYKMWNSVDGKQRRNAHVSHSFPVKFHVNVYPPLTSAPHSLTLGWNAFALLINVHTHDAPSADIWMSIRIWNEMSHCSMLTGPKFGLMLELVYHWYWLYEMIKLTPQKHARTAMSFHWHFHEIILPDGVSRSVRPTLTHRLSFIVKTDIICFVPALLCALVSLILSRRVDFVSTVEKIVSHSVSSNRWTYAAERYAVLPEICFVWRTVDRCWVCWLIRENKIIAPTVASAA